jgi:hypothetical protein
LPAVPILLYELSSFVLPSNLKAIAPPSFPSYPAVTFPFFAVFLVANLLPLPLLVPYNRSSVPSDSLMTCEPIQRSNPVFLQSRTPESRRCPHAQTSPAVNAGYKDTIFFSFQRGANLPKGAVFNFLWCDKIVAVAQSV